MAKKENRHAELVSASANIEAPYELPDGWKWCRLPECVSIVTGKKDANYGTPDGKYLFFTCAEQPLRCDDYSFEGESLLLPGNGANVGQVIYYDGQFEVYQRTYVLQKIIESFSLKYLYYHILGFWENYNHDKQYGSATNYIKMGNFLNYIFPLPPTLAEQQRIVNRIETMFEKLDQAQEKVQAVLDSFETRKAAILHKAFSGQLTANWRKKNGVSDDSWEEKTVGDCCTSLKYGTAKKSESSGKVAVIRMGNLQHGEIEYDDLVFSNDEEDIKKYSLSKGDVLFNRTNSPEWVGKTSIYRGDIPAIYAGYLIKLDYIKTMLIGDYLNYMLNSPNAKEYCNSVKTDGVNQSNINAQKIGAYEIPVPSLSEQQEIVRILDTVLEKEFRAKEAAQTVLDQIALLKKSILARAFRGEL